MDKPTLNDESVSSSGDSRNERLRRFNRRMMRAILAHVIAAYVTFTLLLIVSALRGERLDVQDARKALLAPVTFVVIVPLSFIILLFPAEGAAQPLVFITLPYLAVLLLTVYVMRKHWSASSVTSEIRLGKTSN